VPVTVQNIGAPTTLKGLGEWVKANTIEVAEKALREEVGEGAHGRCSQRRPAAGIAGGG